jgi:hypothetical protein
MFTFNGRIKRKNIVTSKLSREDWLNKSAFFINRDIFSKKGYDLDLKNIKISVGNTQRSTGAKHTVLGTCYSRRMSTGNFNEIVISWAVDDSKEALATLVHELIHAYDNNKNRHSKEVFTPIKNAVGLTGKNESTTATNELNDYFDNIIKSIGKFPHKEVLPTTAKQTTRMLKMVCKCGDACTNSKGNPLTVRQSFTSAVENPIVCHSCMILQGSYNPKFILQADDEAIQMAIEQKRKELKN